MFRSIRQAMHREVPQDPTQAEKTKKRELVRGVFSRDSEKRAEARNQLAERAQESARRKIDAVTETFSSNERRPAEAGIAATRVISNDGRPAQAEAPQIERTDPKGFFSNETGYMYMDEKGYTYMVENDGSYQVLDEDGNLLENDDNNPFEILPPPETKTPSPPVILKPYMDENGYWRGITPELDLYADQQAQRLALTRELPQKREVPVSAAPTDWRARIVFEAPMLLEPMPDDPQAKEEWKVRARQEWHARLTSTESIFEVSPDADTDLAVSSSNSSPVSDGSY